MKRQVCPPEPTFWPAMLSELEKQLQLQYFLDQGFQRRQCTQCRSWFWTLDRARTLCGDAPCAEYSFIGQPLGRRPYELAEMRETFLRFFEAEGHTRVRRRPVVARWRTDIYLTIASIADFQPFVTSGEAQPPANPLCISQPCIRLNDLANVGRSGRHMTTFEMMAHHAFNQPGQEIYWADRTVEYCDRFLSKTLGFAREGITYKENPWAGGGNAGPAVEVLAGGLEVATLVFMNLKADPSGTVDVKGETYSPLALQIVDTGWGLERLTWATQGTPTAYEATYPELIRFVQDHVDVGVDLSDERVRHIVAEHARLAGVLNLDYASNLRELRGGVANRLAAKGVRTTADELELLMAPIENVYALSDHAKCLAFMLGDGIVPSNVKAGYLCRLIIRRSLRLLESLKARLSLKDLVLKELEFLQKDFPELREEERTLAEVLDLETDRYRETIEKGTRLIRSRIRKGQRIDVEQLIELYDTHGVPPSIVSQVAEPLGVPVEIPDAFDAMVADRHAKEKTEKPVARLRIDAPPTRMLYYENPDGIEFDASVLWSDEDLVVLDQTMFYPEGGGQPADQGSLEAGGKVVPVRDAQKSDGIIFHKVGRKLKVGELVHGRIDRERRIGHLRHHTATHIINGAARAILGNHVWQSGANKTVDNARIDLTHYKRITPEEVRKIEALANDIVMRNVPLDRVWMTRDEAEKRYGVRIYQGGVPPGGQIRVIRIGDHDVEACAGTHAAETSDVGPIKIYKSERIQDGVERLEYSAGPKAIGVMQQIEGLLDESARILSVPADKLPVTVERFFHEWKERGKEVESLRAELGHLRLEELLRRAEKVGPALLTTYEGRNADLLPLARLLAETPNAVGILSGTEGTGARIVVARGAQLAMVHCGEVVKVACAAMGGSGGGKPELANGAGPDGTRLHEGVAAARQEIIKRLSGPRASG